MIDNYQIVTDVCEINRLLHVRHKNGNPMLASVNTEFDLNLNFSLICSDRGSGSDM